MKIRSLHIEKTLITETHGAYDDGEYEIEVEKRVEDGSVSTSIRLGGEFTLAAYNSAQKAALARALEAVVMLLRDQPTEAIEEFARFGLPPSEDEDEEEEAAQIMDAFDFPLRAVLTHSPTDSKLHTILSREGITTVDQVQKMTDEDLLQINQIGEGSVKRLREAIKAQ